MAERKTVNAVFLDFNKAFDIVPYIIHLDKLSKHGMSQFTMHWVKKWLKDRAHGIVVSGVTSG